MTQEQVKQLVELQNIFEERCSEVTNILDKMDKYYNTGFRCCDTFRIDSDGDVCCEGDEYWQYGGHEHYVEYFDAKLLSMTNEEIEKYVEEKIQIKIAEQKAKLFDAIKDNGYKWNPETKTLEKLPKFKVGDRIKLNTCSSIYTITDLLKDKYRATIHSYDLYEIEFERQDAYELVPNKFDISTLVPFESKVLVRHNRDNKWCGSFFSHIDEDFYSHCYKFVTTSGRSYPMCIPYEGNEHLLGKTDDCDEYFEIWK